MSLFKSGRGGYRENAKRPLKYGEPTEIVRFSVPKSKVEFIKNLVHRVLKRFEVKRNKNDTT
jgi:hypothetical protein